LAALMAAFLLALFLSRARTLKGAGKIFSHVVGVTSSLSEAEGERQRGKATMEICEVNLGSRAKPGALLGEF